MEKKRLALLGCGKLNHIVADAYLNGILPEYEVVGVLGRTKEKAEALAEKLGCERCENIGALMALKPDYVAEAASVAAVKSYAEAVLAGGANLVVISIGAFADEAFLEQVKMTAKAHGTRVHIASGAVGGFDVLRTISLMGHAKTRMTSYKGPESLQNTPLFEETLLHETEKKKVFVGSSKDAIAILPTKVNVSVATALASVGPEKLEYHINSVPGMRGDDYIIETEVEEAGVKAVLNIYSRTAEIAGWSIVEVLQNAVSPIVF